MKHILLIIFMGSLILSCSQDEASSHMAEDPKVLARNAAQAHKDAMLSLETLLKNAEGDLIGQVDHLYDEHKAKLLSFSKKALELSQKDFEIFTVNYQAAAYADIDSTMIFIAKYRDSLVRKDPGNILSAELQSYSSLGAYASPEMMQRIFPSEYEKTYGSASK